MGKDDPYGIEALQRFQGGPDVKPVDMSATLPRHPTKKYKTRKLSKVNSVVVHCTNVDWTIEKLANYDITGEFKLKDGTIVYNHISKTGCPAITYHDLIDMEGKIFHTLPYEEISWHAGAHNNGSVAVSLMYLVQDPDTGKDTFAPSEKSIKSLQCHIGKLCLKFGLTPDRIFGHRELKGTGWFFVKGHKKLRKTCPGLQVDLDLLRRNVAAYMQLVLKIRGLYTAAIDGDFGKKSKLALTAYLKG